MSGGGDYEGPDCEAEEQRRARVPHLCCACHETIRPGDRYNLYRTLYDGHWSTFKHCLRCWEIVELLGFADFTDGVAIRLDCGHTWEEASRGKPPSHVAALAFWLPGEPMPPQENP